MIVKTLVVVAALLLSAELLVQAKSKNKPTQAPSPDVAQQANESLYVRRENEPWEGDDDVEYTKSQEDGLITPTVSWTKKQRKWQVPFKIDTQSNFTTEELTSIENELRAIGTKLNVTFKAPQYETYVVTISSVKQCVENLLQKVPQLYNEIPVCFDAKLKVASEISRAVAIGLQINEQISHDSSEEEDEDDDDNE
jgi:hypothetical protein